MIGRQNLDGKQSEASPTEGAGLRETGLIRPTYSERFRCIGPRCEDSCCKGWTVPVDKEAFEKYRALPAGPLRVLLDENLVETPNDPNPAHFAKIKMPASNECPILTEEGLCRIHAELGEEYLCHTCATYPRAVSNIDNLEEKALSMSCPEAARLVLLDPGLIEETFNGNYEMTWDDAPERADREPLGFFWPVREFVFTLLRDRSYPLWQRLFLMGSFCRRMDAIARGESERGVTAFLRDFAGAVNHGALRAAMETIPADLHLQLDMVLRLAGLCRDRSAVGARFVECLETFKRGIDARPDATMRDLIAAYAGAYQKIYAPFFARNPHILENYLANAIFRRQFPYGLKDGKLQPKPEMTREYALLATQFALIKGLLIGVAGAHGEAFAEEHLVYTIQSASKHFDHHPQFLDQVHELLVKTGRDNPHGLTMLLRN